MPVKQLDGFTDGRNSPIDKDLYAVGGFSRTK